MIKEDYEQLLDMAEDFVYVIDRDMVLTYINRQGAASLGLKQEEAKGKSIDLLFSPAVQPHVRSSLLRVIESGMPVSGMHNFRQRDKTRWMDVKLTPLLDSNGRVARIIGISRDITKLKRTEQVLQSSEKFLSSVLECIQDGISVLDKDLNIIMVNQVMDKWYGHMMPLAGKKCYQAYHGRSYPCEICPSRMAISQCKANSCIVPFLGAGGEPRGWMEVYSFPLRDEDGTVVGVIEHVRDITQRKKAEMALQESEASFALAQKIAHLGNWERDLKTGELKWSDEVFNIYGVKRGEFIPNYESFISFVHPDDREIPVKKSTTALHEGKQYSADFRIVRPDGMERFVHVESNYIIKGKDGMPSRMFGTVQDITDRIQIENALRESEDIFRALAETSTSIIALVQNGKIIYLNPRCKDIIGYNKDDIGKMNFWNLVSPDDREMVQKRIAERLSGQNVPARYDVRIATSSGNFVWIDASMAVIIHKGMPAELITAVDITEKKLREEEMKKAKATAELYLDLMGHDINNMHQVALGYLELAMENYAESQKEYLERPIDALQRSARLIKNVRKLQELQEGSIPAIVMDLCEVLSNVREDNSRVQQKTITLNLNGNEHCLVKANDLLYDVFSNLVSNAIKHTGDRAEITISLEHSADGNSRHYRVAVEDNGTGIPDDSKSAIFNRMQQGTTQAKGLGLGLFLVKSLMESYGGRVWVEDRVPGDHTKGARFVVSLPVAE